MPFQLTVLRHSCKESMDIKDSLSSGISKQGEIKAKTMGTLFKNQFGKIKKVNSAHSLRCIETSHCFIETYNPHINVIPDPNIYGTISLGSFIKKNKINDFMNYLIDKGFDYYGYDKYNELFYDLYKKGISKFKDTYYYYEIFSEKYLNNENNLIITNGTNIGAILTTLSLMYSFKYNPRILWPKYLSGISLIYDKEKEIEEIKFISFFKNYEDFSLL